MIWNHLSNSVSRSPVRRGFLFVAFALDTTKELCASARIASFFGFVFSLACWPLVSTQGAPPTLNAPRAILTYPAANETLLSKSLDDQVLQGSLAKLMTGYVARSHGGVRGISSRVGRSSRLRTHDHPEPEWRLIRLTGAIALGMTKDAVHFPEFPPYPGLPIGVVSR